jgi:2OG-Fe dioxygenase
VQFTDATSGGLSIGSIFDGLDGKFLGGPAHGGEVIITDNDKNEMDRFTMRERGECYVFDDDRIWHMLTPLAVLRGNQYAYRDTLAFDMLPESWEPVA